MQRREPPILGFRRRLLRLIAEQVDGRYTILARRARIPISSMQHIMHDATHLPGGEPLQKLAGALGVTVQYLSTGHEGSIPPSTPGTSRPRGDSPGEAPVPGLGRHARHAAGVPVRVPGAVSLTQAVPPTLMVRAGVVLARTLLAAHTTIACSPSR